MQAPKPAPAPAPVSAPAAAAAAPAVQPAVAVKPHKTPVQIVPYTEGWKQAVEKRAKSLLSQAVRVSSSASKQVLKQLNIPYEESASNTNPHSNSAAIRHYMTQVMASYVAKDYARIGEQFAVLLVCTSAREIQVLQSIPDLTGHLRTDNRSHTAADIAREVSPLQTEYPIVDVVMYDIYQVGGESLLAYVARLFEENPSIQVVYDVIKRYSGLGGDQYGEGAWYRDGHTIHAKASMSELEMTNDDCSWAFEPGTCDGVSWTPVRVIGLEQMIMFKRAVVANRPLVPKFIGCEELALPTGSFRDQLLWSILQYLPNPVQLFFLNRYGTKVWCDSAWLQSAINALLSRRRASTTMLATGANAAMDVAREYPIFSVAFPARCREMVQLHHMAAWYMSTVYQSNFVRAAGPTYAWSAGINQVANDFPMIPQFTLPYWFVAKLILTGFVLLKFVRWLMTTDVGRVVTWLWQHRLGPAQLFPEVGELTTVLIEEACRSLLGTVGTLFLGLAEFVRYDSNRAMSAALVHFLLELARVATLAILRWYAPRLGYKALAFDLALRILLHYVANVTSKVPDRRDAWAVEKRQLSDIDPQEMLTTDDPNTRKVTPIDVADVRVIPRRKPFVEHPVTVYCDRITVYGDLAAMSEDLRCKGRVCTYAFPTNVHLYVPCQNGANLHAAVVNRILKPHIDYDGQQQTWLKIRAALAPVLADYDLGQIEDLPELYEDYLAHLPPAKQKKMRKAYFRLNREPLTLDDFHVRTTQLMVKADEAQVRPNGDLKPRCIAVVHPLVQVSVGPFLREATRRLHEQWSVAHTSGEPFCYVNHLPYYVIWASGLSDVEIGAYADVVLDNHKDGVHIIIAGDDAVVAVNFKGTLLFYESDASAYDQSQGAEVLEFEYDFLKALGVPKRPIAFLRAVSSATYLIPEFSVALVKKKRPMRDTGGPDTTIGNSMVMAGLWFHVLVAVKPENYGVDAFQRAFPATGVEMKIRVTPDLNKVSFLKGMFYEQAGRHVWGPLPSRFLKMGKVIADLQLVYPHVQSKQRALELYCNAIAASYRTYIQPPLIRAWCRRFNEHLDPYKIDMNIYCHGSSLEAQNVLEQAAAHYSIDPAMFLDAEKLFLEACLPSLLQHPVFWVLAVDYS